MTMLLGVDTNGKGLGLRGMLPKSKVRTFRYKIFWGPRPIDKKSMIYLIYVELRYMGLGFT